MENSHFEKGVSQEVKSYEQSQTIARSLLEKYKDQIHLANAAPEDPEARFGSEQAIGNFLRKVPEEVRDKYSGHGITKGDDLDQLTTLLNVCQNSVVSGDEGRLSGGAYSAYLHGSSVVCSRKDEKLFVKNIKPGTAIKSGTFEVNEFGKTRGFSEVSIGCIILAPKWYPLQAELQSMFPSITFVKANQIPEYFSER